MSLAWRFKIMAGLSTCVAMACSASIAPRPAPQALPPLQTSNPAANGPVLMKFVDQQCVHRADDMAAFVAGLKATGWQMQQTQGGDRSDRLALRVWELPGATLLLGESILDRAWTCALALQPQVSPDATQLRTMATRMVGHASDSKGEWWWVPRAGYRAHLVVDAVTRAGPHGYLISTELYRLPWWREMLDRLTL